MAYGYPYQPSYFNTNYVPPMPVQPMQGMQQLPAYAQQPVGQQSALSFLNGAPSSGGSTKNWITKIPAGCVVKIYGVPRGLAEKEIVNLKNGITAQIESIEDFDRAALESEREMLMARIVEIDAILNRKQ